MLLSVAGICFEVNNRYKKFEEIAKEFIVPYGFARFTICVDDNDIKKEQMLCDTVTSKDYLECTAILRKFAENVALLGVCVFHGAVIKINGKAIAFTGKSTAGKTTQAVLWKKHFKDKVKFINGDKPILCLNARKVIAFSSPWKGKEMLGENIFSELRAVCFVNKSETDYVKRLTKKEGSLKMLKQMYCFGSDRVLDSCINLLHIQDSINFFDLFCTKKDSAVKECFRALEEIIFED